MSDEELDEACEMAGLSFRILEPAMQYDPGCKEWITPDGEWGWEKEDPALPAYVASLLVAKIQENSRIKPRVERAYNMGLWKFGLSHGHGDALATDEERIHVAMKVLRKNNESNTP